MQAALSILPVILLVALGYVAKRWQVISSPNWPGVEQLGFRLLFPAILLVSIYRSDLSFGSLAPYILALAIAFVITGGTTFLMRRPLGLSNPRFSSLFQGAMRFNSLLVLALASQSPNAGALSDLAVAMALFIPSFNIASIVVLTLYPAPSGQSPSRTQSLRRISREISRNPLVLACVIGLLLNLSNIGLPQWVLSPLEWLGQGALAVGLLSVGAGIELRRLWQSDAAMWIGVAMSLLMCPVLFLMAAMGIGLPSDQIASGLLLSAAPGASVGYILARQMGGDAEFFADMFTWQTVLSAVTLPLWLILAARLTG